MYRIFYSLRLIASSSSSGSGGAAAPNPAGITSSPTAPLIAAPVTIVETPLGPDGSVYLFVDPDNKSVGFGLRANF